MWDKSCGLLATGTAQVQTINSLWRGLDTKVWWFGQGHNSLQKNTTTNTEKIFCHYVTAVTTKKPYNVCLSH